MWNQLALVPGRARAKVPYCKEAVGSWPLLPAFCPHPPLLSPALTCLPGFLCCWNVALLWLGGSTGLSCWSYLIINGPALASSSCESFKISFSNFVEGKGHGKNTVQSWSYIQITWKAFKNSCAQAAPQINWFRISGGWYPGIGNF